MAFDYLGPIAVFLDEFDGGNEEVVVKPPLFFTEVVHERNDFRVCEASVPESLADVRIVFALDMGVIVFLVFAGASELDRDFSVKEITNENLVEKLVAVKAEEFKGQGILDIRDLGGTVFAAGGPLFGPAGRNIDGIGSHCVMALNSRTTMGDGIGFKESWF